MLFSILIISIIILWSLSVEKLISLCKAAKQFNKDKKEFNFQSPKYPPVSVIICSHNGQDKINSNLPFIINQQYPQFEIIIIDDRSNPPLHYSFPDNSETKIIHLESTPPDWNPKKWALYNAFLQAKYPLILCTDDDCRPASNQWIQQFNTALQIAPIAIGISPYQTKSGLLNILIRFETYITATNYISSALLGKPYMSVGRNVAYHQSVINQIDWQPLKNKLGGDDDLILQQLIQKNNKCTVVTSPQSYTISSPKTTYSQWFRQKARHYKTASHYHPSIQFKTTIYIFVYIIFHIILVILPFFNPANSLLLLITTTTFLSTHLYFQNQLNLQMLSISEFIIGSALHPFILVAQGLYAWWPFRKKTWS